MSGKIKKGKEVMMQLSSWQTHLAQLIYEVVSHHTNTNRLSYTWIIFLRKLNTVNLSE